MFEATLAAASYVDEGFTGHYFGPDVGFHETVCLKFKDLDAYRTYMCALHGPDEAAHLRDHIARISAFDVITPDEPVDTGAKIIELYKERWKLFPDVAKVLREEVDARLPFL